ncbi:SGNH/GDSL hydrolase family protein [Planctomycetes bacterium K23_9]|uniref:GDSL-like Lipase/Acylhydrolase n=1 Tax=Stieleria marina TaxID=1930275 RepID=A0A517NNB4_9BACT|nr:GDSL-like Lipase/Acylhydrolase [Planctomycetes bacterium K23_9]
MSFPKCLCVVFVLFASSYSAAEQSSAIKDAKRIVFLGDSNTFAGHFVVVVEAHLRMQLGKDTPEIINLGLGSETCNGMSEPIHPFPRPNVHERIDRALSKIKPDVVVACYGMNDGIYHPPSDKVFAAYREGIDKIISKVNASGAKLVLMTPPAFDALPLQKKGKLRPLGAKEYSWKTIYENYDEVIKQFADYVNDQSDRVELVVDLHGPISDYVADKRETDPGFTLSGDGVHVNNQGHRVLAHAILKTWGFDFSQQPDAELVNLIKSRQTLMRDAWLSEVGHLRPGIKAGLPIKEAEQRATEIDRKISEQRQQTVAN